MGGVARNSCGSVDEGGDGWEGAVRGPGALGAGSPVPRSGLPQEHQDSLDALWFLAEPPSVCMSHLGDGQRRLVVGYHAPIIAGLRSGRGIGVGSEPAGTRAAPQATPAATKCSKTWCWLASSSRSAPERKRDRP